MRSFIALTSLTLASAATFAQIRRKSRALPILLNANIHEANNFTFTDVLGEAGKLLKSWDPDLEICKVDCYPLGRPGRAVPYQQLNNITFTARASNDSFYTFKATSTHGFGELESYDPTEVEIESALALNGSLTLDIGSAANRVKPNGTFSHASILQLNFTSQGTVAPVPVWLFYVGTVTPLGQEQCTISMDESSESCIA